MKSSLSTRGQEIGDEELIRLLQRESLGDGRGSQVSVLGPLPSDEGYHPTRLEQSTEQVVYPSSLDFERVVNQYSIQAMRDRVLQGPPHRVKESFRDSGTSDATTDDGESPLKPNQGRAYSTFDPDLDDDSRLPPPPPPPLNATRSLLARSKLWASRRLETRQESLGFTGRTVTRWFLTLLTGLMTGMISILIVSCTDAIQEWRSDMMDSLFRSRKHSTLIFALYAGVNLTLAMLSSLLCLAFAPEAVGSGIPEVKAYLNGVRVKRFTNVRLFLVKIVGTVLSVSSGLVIGPEGPLVHIGAILGASCTKLYDILHYVLPPPFLRQKRIWSFLIMDLSHFAKDSERRNLVSIGAGAGFAAAFGAPIGGLLFSLEEASSYFDQPMFLRTLAATALATFCLAVHHGNLSDYSIISLGHFHSSDEHIFLLRAVEFPLYILVATAGGVLGGLFCRFWTFLQMFRHRVFKEARARRNWNLFQVASVSLLTSALLYYVPLLDWSCRRVDLNDDLVEGKSMLDPWKWHPHQFDCPTGYINELATIFFGSREDAISSILTDPKQFQPLTLWSVGILSFTLMTLTLGIYIPSGIFMPTFLVGTSMGGASGIAFQAWLGQEVSPSTFALLGAAALLAGSQRSTVSLCVILVEGTGQVKILIPVIVTVVIARWVADWISPHGLYEAAMLVSHYPYMDHEEPKKLDVFRVREIMSSPPVTLRPRERANSVVKLLRASQHHGFPVVDPHSKRFLGLVRRDQLVALLECGVFDEGPAADDESSVNSSAPGSPDWTPRPGVTKTPLMHLAYHITDDRYDRIGETPPALANRSLAADDFDANAWLLSVRQTIEQSIRGFERSPHRPKSLALGDESMPPIESHEESNFKKRVAEVGVNHKGNVYIKRLDPECRGKWLNLAAVMNRGTYCVNDFCPVSKAHHIFTALGLRHLIVLGGESGGEVVGLLTRINFVKEYLEERTRYSLH